MEGKTITLNSLKMERLLRMSEFEKNRIRARQATEVIHLLFSYV